jgi:hypothetical protein
MILLQPVVEMRLLRCCTPAPESVRIALGQLSCASVMTRSGVTRVTMLADSKNAFEAAMSRCSLNITSTGAPE